MKKIICLCMMFISAVNAADTEFLTALKGSEYQSMHSKILDHDYHIFVKVPQIPDSSKQTKLPTVYLLDGGNTFPMLVPYAGYMTFFEEIPPVIMVGISYGTSDWRQGNKRSTDFTLPSKERAHYGGAEKFHQFLTQELIPEIEKKYPSDSQQRILFGHSLGGQFVLYNTMFQPQTFKGLIASNPAIHRNLDLFLEPVSLSKQHPKLYIVEADGDSDEFKIPRKKWLDYWQQKPHHWQLKTKKVTGHNHMSSLPAAFRQGMKWLLTTENN